MGDPVAGAPAAGTPPVAEPKKEVTQEAIDRIYKEMRESKEKLDRAEAEKVQLVGRIALLEKKTVPPVAPPADDKELPLNKRFNENNFPTTDEEWDDLIAEFPTYGVDLRQKFKEGTKIRISEFERRYETSRKKVEAKHPDMFVRDSEGNFVLDKDGLVQIDQTNPKAQVMLKIVEADPSIMQSPSWPTLVMEAMENRMAGKKGEEVAKELEDKKKKEEETRLKGVKAGAVASGGEPPPIVKPKVEVSFNSQEEKRHAEGLVASGKIKSLEDYCAVRNSSQIPYSRGGF